MEKESLRFRSAENPEVGSDKERKSEFEKRLNTAEKLRQLSSKSLRISDGFLDAAEKYLKNKPAEAITTGNSVADQLEALAKETRDLVKDL